VKLNSGNTKRTSLVNAAPRRVLGGTLLPYLLIAAAMPAGLLAAAQVAVPKYQGPLAAPATHETLPAPAPITPNGEVVEYPIVRVNDGIIDRGDYERAEQQLVEDAQRDHATPAELEQRKKDLLRDMIDKQLLLSRGKELDINADSELIRRLDDIRKQYHFDSMEALEKAIRESGISYEDYKATQRNDIITQEVIRDEVGRNLHLTAKMEQAYYDQHKQEFAQPESERLSEILIPTPDNPTDEQLAQAQAKADDVVAKLKAGAKFENLVKLYPDSPNPDKGGDLNADYKRGDGQLAKVLEDQTFALKAGESTAPIRTREGFVVFKVTEHTPAGIPPLSAIDEQVQQTMFQEAMAPALRTYLTDLREKAYVDIAPGFVDTGASPKETKPVYAASTPPAAKKKTKKGRLDQGRPGPPAATSTTPATAAAVTPSAASPAPVAASTAKQNSKPAKTENVAMNKKPRKVHREKIRYGQAPRNSLPVAPEETLASGSDQGPGAANTLPPPGAAIASIDQSTTTSDVDPLAPKASQGKTRFADRAPLEAKTKTAAKTLKTKQKAAATPPPLSAEEKAAQQVQNAPLGLRGDTATKKKPKKVKGAPKERIQEAPPTPPAPKPDATPIPPKSVRDNGEPAVAPPPSNLPPVTPPATDTPSAAPANPAPAPQ
jgi:peptidyl-prolyl cis-trans isomerase SurA